MRYQAKTIAAISSPVGIGAIGIIRLSGTEALHIIRRLAPSLPALDNLEHRRIYGASIIDPGSNSLLDRAYIAMFRAPRSYTGEDMAELYCHGNPLLMRRILDCMFALGAEPAEPGEFTRRAFLNGRMELSQASAVADLIAARSDAGIKVAAKALASPAGGKLKEYTQRLRSLLVEIEAALNFPEDDIEVISRDKLRGEITGLLHGLQLLLSSSRNLAPLFEGIKTPILGIPNVGKSRLFNLLVKKDRSIVSDIPGTTRDYISEEIAIGEYTFTLIDTAGFRRAGDEIELEGQRRATLLVSEADMLIVLLDGSLQPNDEQLGLLDASNPGADKRLVLFNKADLAFKWDDDTLKRLGLTDALHISAKFETGIDELERELINKAQQHFSVDCKEELIYDLRQRRAISQGANEIGRALEAIDNELSLEYIAFDLRQALNQLGILTGEVTSEEILDEIFSRFCIGK